MEAAFLCYRPPRKNAAKSIHSHERIKHETFKVTRPYTRRGCLLTCRHNLTYIRISADGTAQPANAQIANNVLLVHGAWADGSSWARVIPRLTAVGLNVVAVQIPLTSLADDVAATERAIALVDGPVLLVGHSYGGAVITEAGNDPKVVGLVFVAAFAPNKGESSLSLATANPSRWRRNQGGYKRIS